MTLLSNKEKEVFLTKDYKNWLNTCATFDKTLEHIASCNDYKELFRDVIYQMTALFAQLDSLLDEIEEESLELAVIAIAKLLEKQQTLNSATLHRYAELHLLQ